MTRPVRRALVWGALIAAVIALHAGLTIALAGRLRAIKAAAAMPPRIEVAYVRDMALAPPPIAAAAAPPPAAPVAATPRRRSGRPKAIRPPPAASAASAPEVPTAAASGPAESALAAESAASTPEAPGMARVEAPADAPSAPSPSTFAAADASIASSAAEASVSAPASAPAASATGAPSEPFQWPASTRVSYGLTGYYRGAVQGTAQVEWLRVGSHYQVHVDFLIGPSFAPIITQRSSSDGEIGAAGLVPHRYDQQTGVLGSQRPLQTLRFDASGVTLANGERRAAPPNVQDSASQFIQLTFLFSTRPELLRVGGSIDIPLALPRKVDSWTYDVTEQVELQTPFGPLDALHLVPRKPPGPGALRVEMWFAPQLRYFPARLRIEQDAGTYVDLLIEKPPEMAN